MDRRELRPAVGRGSRLLFSPRSRPMFGRLLPFAVLSLMVSLVGCSGSHRGRLSNDPADYALTIKKRVKEFLAAVRQNPKSTAQEAAVLVETLEAHTTAPVGDYQ